MFSKFVGSNSNRSARLIVGIHKFHGAVVRVERDSTRFENGSSGRSSLHGRKDSIVIRRFVISRVASSSSINSRFESHITISTLASELFSDDISSRLPVKRINRSKSSFICVYKITSVALGNSYFTLVSHVEPTLLSMHISFRGNPRAGISCMSMSTVFERALGVFVAPLNSKSDCIFSLYSVV